MARGSPTCAAWTQSAPLRRLTTSWWLAQRLTRSRGCASRPGSPTWCAAKTLAAISAASKTVMMHLCRVQRKGVGRIALTIMCRLPGQEVSSPIRAISCPCSQCILVAGHCVSQLLDHRHFCLHQSLHTVRTACLLQRRRVTGRNQCLPLELFELTVTVRVQEPDELFETLAQCLLSGVDRDALSGWGGIVNVM